MYYNMHGQRTSLRLSEYDYTQSDASLGDVICTYKSLTTLAWRRYCRENGKEDHSTFWQRNYYERVIRNEEELTSVRTYILNNPLQAALKREG
jgi:REP element-mobilizing transposase RayT